ncbi:MAG: nucleotidyl transferase AbiEii/AbiGii toxin family protein [Patescibacteria group bacterium]|nr:nucleotidyl transferase AbiEii/AbiGii toxin family protein [Patescibacteria group bacterium]
MDDASRKKIESNFSILPLETKKAFVFLSEQLWLAESAWYLAGGTALALQVGNRKSVDLDFFTTEKDFNKLELLDNFLGNNEWATTLNRKNTVYGELFKAKISFIAYPFFVPKQDFIQYGSIKILQSLDVAVMKIIAISQRGRKRDFFDLYWCAKNLEPLENLIKRLKEQYPSVAHDFHHILKSLVYFEDAESDPPPDIFFEADWEEVKNYIKKEILRITREIILE